MQNEKAIRTEIMSLTAKLRNAYYATHEKEPRGKARAFGGKPTESIGPFAEYNLRGCHCRRSLSGLCSPCFYSKFPEIIGITDYTQYFIEQIDYLIDNFESTVASKLIGNVYYDPMQMLYKDKSPLVLCLTPVGSFFDDNEFSPKAREHLLTRLVQKSHKISNDIILYVETHVLDFLRWDKSKTDAELVLMKNLHLRVVFGFESKDSFVRNSLYCKSIELNDFESATALAKQHGFMPYAFVFAGLYPMTHNEILGDISATFKYLKDLEIAPVLMFANVQEYTIGDLLVKSGFAMLVSPLTVLEVMKIMLDIFGRTSKHGCDAWLIADPVGGPPSPATHIFKENGVSCCSEKIYRLITELRADHEYSAFDEHYYDIKHCEKHRTVLESLSRPITTSLLERTMELLDFANRTSEGYIQNLRNQELTQIKALLLCEGVMLDENAAKAMQAMGIASGFIHSTNLLLGGFPVNACIMESLVENPHCSIAYHDGKFYLHCSNESESVPEFIGEIDFIGIPDWGSMVVDGLLVSDFLRPHSEHCISIWPNQVCGLGNQKCKFCSLEGNVVLDPATVAKMVDVALDYDPTYEVHISGGLFGNFKQNEDYYTQIASIIHNKHPTTKISLETTPPSSPKGIQKYKMSGVSSLIMNLEIANEVVRKEICEGKSNISLQQYFEAYEESVKEFGAWNVSSVLLWGIDGVTKEQLLSCASKMCDIGVYPVIMPFQPLADSELRAAAPTDAESFLDVSKAVGEIVTMHTGSEAVCKFGCINCGACSIENYFVKENLL